MTIPKLEKYLCCPECKASLEQKKNTLFCLGCGQHYSIREGIPILVDLKNLPPHLRGQVDYFEKEGDNRQGYRLEEWQKSYIRRLNENFSFQKNEVLIDVGTGIGYIAVEMAKRGLLVIACDLTFASLVDLKKVREKEGLENNLYLVCCTAEALPFKEKIADYLVANALIEHLPKEEEAISEMARVGKTKSGLMITAPNQLKYIWPFFWLFHHWHDKRIGHLHKYDREVIASKFGRRGYKIQRVYYPGHLAKAFALLLSALGVKEEKWERWAESRDQKKENKRYGSTNICAILKRG